MQDIEHLDSLFRGCLMSMDGESCIDNLLHALTDTSCILKGYRMSYVQIYIIAVTHRNINSHFTRIVQVVHCLTKYKKVTIKTIIKDFFDIKQKPGSYLTAFLFLFIDFLPVFFSGKLIIASWYTPFVIFLSSLLLGGIEEIPWRYFFQPALQEKHSYVPSTLITFIAWEIWHLPFIYLWDHIVISDIPSFSLGLLTNCFILSALFIRTKSLWICVMTHSMINVLTQITSGGSTAASVICKAVIIGLAIFLSSSAQKADKETPLNKTDPS